jgi:hypothetical protein
MRLDASPTPTSVNDLLIAVSAFLHDSLLFRELSSQMLSGLKISEQVKSADRVYTIALLF